MRPYHCCLLALVATSIFYQFPPSAKAALDNVPLDLAIIMRAQVSDNVVGNVKKVLGQLPETFPFGPEKTRVAVLAIVAANWTILTNLTESESEYETALSEIKQFGSDNDLEQPLEMVREKIFLDPTRPRLILLINDRWNESGGAIKEAERLRSSGVSLCIICDRVKNTLEGLEALSICAMPTSLATHFGRSDLEWVKGAFGKWLCEYNSSCFFADGNQSACAKGWWTPSVPDSYGSCSEIETPPPLIAQPCDPKECSNLCDAFWPWPKPTPDCNQTCGKTDVGRVGTAGWKQLEFCPRQFECQECSTEADPVIRQHTDEAKTNSSSYLHPWQIGLIVALVVGSISVAAIIGMLAYRRKRRRGLGTVKLRYGQLGSGLDSVATTTIVGPSAISFTARTAMSPLSEVSARSSFPRPRRRSKSGSKSFAPKPCTKGPAPKSAGTRSSSPRPRRRSKSGSKSSAPKPCTKGPAPRSAGTKGMPTPTKPRPVPVKAASTPATPGAVLANLSSHSANGLQRWRGKETRKKKGVK